MDANTQLDLFGCIEQVYTRRPNEAISNQELYRLVGEAASIDPADLERRSPVGAAGALHNTLHRTIRWQQQSLKGMGVIERVEGARGVWQLTEKARKGLNTVKAGVTLLGFSTDLGMALWGTSPDALGGLDEPVELVLTSPPYPLQQPRAYGNPPAHAFADFICAVLEPIVDKLSQSGSVLLNLSNDIFLPGSPGRSTYLERATIAIEDRLGLTLMDRIIWENRSKAPGPLQWASKTRQQLNVAWEPCLWFAKSPTHCKADNRRVLQPHTERQLRLIQNGGETRITSYGDDAYRLRRGSFSEMTAGSIPKNVLQIGHACRYGREQRKRVAELGLPQHGAGWPFALADFFIRFLTEEHDLVVDPFAGRGMTGFAAEKNGRRWVCVESVLQYLRGGAEMLSAARGYWINPALEAVA